ncbi:MAG: HAD family hydrolase [Nanobdellota archaeon]
MKAIIFDMDGVIANSMPLHESIYSELLKPYGISINSKDFRDNYAGKPIKDIFYELIKDKKKAEEFANIKSKKVIERIDEVIPVKGVVSLIKKYSDYPLAVASGSEKMIVDEILKHLGVYNNFDAIVSSSDVKKGKPDPEIYLKAADILNINPKDCIVIEDAYNGVLAAKRAGMKCVGLVEDDVPENHENFPADIIVKSLKELNLSSF